MEPPRRPVRLFLVHEPGDDSRSPLAEALRRHRLAGYVGAGQGWVESASAHLVMAGDHLLALSDGRLVPGPSPEELVDQVHAQLGGVAVVEEARGDWEEEWLAARGLEQEASGGPATPSPTAVRTVHVVHGSLPLEDGRVHELPLVLSSGVWAVPDEERVVVVPDLDGDPVGWPRSARPVVRLDRVGPCLGIAAYLARDGEGLRRKHRLVASAMANGWWLRPAQEAVHDELAVTGSADRDLLDAAADIGRPGAWNTDDLAAELDLDAAGRDLLVATLRRPRDQRTEDDLARALGLPAAAVALLAGADPADWPGALRAERQSLYGGVRDAVFTEPTGTGWWSRYRALPFRHPVVAAVNSLLWLSVSVALVVTGVVLGGTPGTALVVVGVVAVLLGLADAAFLVAVRRRRGGRGRGTGSAPEDIP